MVRKGYPFHFVPYVLGLHDFGQFNRDIFRKSFTHAQKHLHLLPDLIPKMRARARQDADFDIALQGIAEGLKATEDVRIDIRYPLFRQRFDALELPEKDAAADAEFADVDAILDRWAQADDLVVRRLPMSARAAMDLGPDARFDRWSRLRWTLQQRRAELRAGMVPVYAVAAGLEQCGIRLKRAVQKR